MGHPRRVHTSVHGWDDMGLTHWDPLYATFAGWQKQVWRIYCILKVPISYIPETEKVTEWHPSRGVNSVEGYHCNNKGLGFWNEPMW